MSTRFKIFGVIAALMLVAAPFAGHADVLPHVTSASCDGVTGEDSTGTCTTTFELTVAGYASNFDSHASLHEFLGLGDVDVKWFDAQGNLIVESECKAALGLAVDVNPIGWVGPFEQENIPCTTTTERDTYVEGTQRLVVTANVTACLGTPGATGAGCRYSGEIAISDPSAIA
jgi:hypothetical protein